MDLTTIDGTAEQAHAVDAASRPQDRGFFEGQNWLERDPDLVVAAQLMGRALGGSFWQRNGTMAPSNAFLTLLQQIFRLPRMQLDSTGDRSPVWACVLTGTGFGLLWGVAARIWMRLISTQPDFSLFGTAALLLITTLFGTFVGLAFAARQQGWRRWGHYVPRGLVVTFFLPFGIAGGMPLMLTVLVAALALTHTAMVGVWVLASLVLLLAVVTDFDIPLLVAISVPVGAIALSVWKWLTLRWQDRPAIARVDFWLERLARMLLLLLALGGFGIVAREILTNKPGLLGVVYVLCYIVLLYPLFLALRVGLEPIKRIETHPARHAQLMLDG